MKNQEREQLGLSEKAEQAEIEAEVKKNDLRQIHSRKYNGESSEQVTELMRKEEHIYKNIIVRRRQKKDNMKIRVYYKI